MTERELQIQSKLMRLEATALFAKITMQLESISRARNINKGISAYSAWLRLDYSLAGIPLEIYIERELHSAWKYTLHVEGKEREHYLMELLQPLREAGFEVSDGNENLTRQINFSLGLYGACQMHILIRPSDAMPVMEAPATLLRIMEQINTDTTPVVTDPELADDDTYGFDDGVIFGDWQTWK